MSKRTRLNDALPAAKKWKQTKLPVPSDLVPHMLQFCKTNKQAKFRRVCKEWNAQILKHVLTPRLFGVFQTITSDYFYEQGTPITEYQYF